MKAVTLRLDDELFAIEAANVREILDMIPVTRVPNAPAFVAGLVNVRGSVVPLADFRVIFGMARRDVDPDTRIVVLDTVVEGEPLVVGLLADRVEDVADLAAADIGPAPKVGLRWPPAFVRGVGQREGRFVILPDLERIFASRSAAEGGSASAERRG
ncbi:MAG: chemotaxis protein CheW [Rubrimonas sp.]|uniref:chemotaxis protein CheW n=1 Tax=Rubrimonas sp. TaxID=2036015 RepID=UPI002FDD70FA